ncbi:MAG: formylglycine-generating enzyme family protein [Candidatus Coatesbacteria bacterium]|nr:formylglycine-generating enzyme family protein [Candidatus Coatesbacteria bacterium]
MVAIPGGTFLMGSQEDEVEQWYGETPQRTVNVSAFQISETEITQEQWENLMGWNESLFKCGNHPVEIVSWFDCIDFCNRLSEAEGYAKCYAMENVAYLGAHITSADVTCDWEADGYRLPTEAEWEYACRAGSTTRYYWGDGNDESIMKQYCWYAKNAYDHYWANPSADELGTQPVGRKIPNAYGLYDIAGNVGEFCWDWADFGYYGTRPDVDANPTGPESGSSKIARGGSWESLAQECRSAIRHWNYVWEWGFSVGFRVVRRD